MSGSGLKIVEGTALSARRGNEAPLSDCPQFRSPSDTARRPRSSV